MSKGLLVIALVAVSACATNDRGWTGSGEPFDQALASCQAQVGSVADAAARETALEQCIAPKGWRRRN